MPKVMQFYAYAKGADKEDANKRLIEDITELWTFYLKQQVMHSNSKLALKSKSTASAESSDGLSDLQMEAFKSFYRNYLTSVLKTDILEDYVGTRVYYAALENAGISIAKVSQSKLEGNNLKTFLKLDKDGIEVNVVIDEFEDKGGPDFEGDCASFQCRIC
jgi:hypothetical protein